MPTHADTHRSDETAAQEARWDAERLSIALSAARLGDWSWDARTDIVTFSERAAAIFGIPPGPQMTWAAMRELIHEDDRERARLAVETSLRDHIDYRIEYRLVNGRERWVSVSGRGRYEANGTPVSMFGVVEDVTRDRLLTHLDDRVRPLVEPEDITFTAARMLGEHLDVDRCAYAFVDDDQDGFTLTGNYTRGVPSIVGRYRFRQFGAECLRLMRAGEAWVVTDSHVDPRIDAEDREAYVLTAIRAVICVPILKSGRFVAAMAVHMQTPRTWSKPEVELACRVASRCWESIERARVERERKGLLAAAEAANQAKDEFLAMLGHELRNPRAPIRTALELMNLRGDTSSSRERTIIERQVSHLTRLVDDLLDVARITRGKVALKRAPVELAHVVARAIEIATPLLEQRAHTMTIDVPAQGLTVLADAERLTQVVSNLLTNACKYTPTGGHVAIASEADGEWIALRVRDDGVGISEDVLPHVFERFVQARQTIDRSKGGLGLGLTIVRSLVETHGGTVTASSAGLDHGSEFVVRLPRMRASEADPPHEEHAARPSDPPHGARVLVVDDNVDAADMLAEVLGTRGCEVRVANDPVDALRIAETDRFDAALLDIGLPVMDGYELATRLRTLPTMSSTRLVAVTGYGQASDRERAFAAGFHEHLVKPVDLEALTRILAELPAVEAHDG